MKAYLFDDQPGDCRFPHDSGIELSVSDLAALGVIYHNLPTKSASSLAELDKLAAARNYSSRDEITVSPDAMGAVYEEKIQMFFNEHMHEDEEIRYCLKGKGYFDVRNINDEWVRIKVEPGDLLVLPQGIYHRFTVDEDNYINAMRLYQAAPKWAALKRGGDTDASGIRQDYVNARSKGFSTSV